MTVLLTRPSSGKNARHRVRDEVERMILAGQLKPGEKLPQQRLAGQFGVALGVLRESLLELAARGLIDVVDNLGMFVVELDARRVLEAFEIRELHEGLAARLCCRRASREHLTELESLVERIHGLAQSGRLDEAADADRSFHRRILEIAGNVTLERLMASFCILRLVLAIDSDLHVVHAAHRAVLEAIRDNRPDDAEQLMREHVRSARRVIEDEIRLGKFSPAWLK